ncbi:MAG: transporter substrate-binding domain-containing protein [Campylobacterota bacterium]|nr:transporter substrate-binding domain-containing protein [Campylobacterota bacterium]
MKKILLILLTISVSLFAVSTIDSSTLGDIKLTKEEKTWLKDNPIIKVASMTYWNHDGKDNTIHSDYLKLLNKYGNLNIIPTKHDTWEDGYNQAISGKNDIHAIMNLSWSKEREEKYFLYTKSYNFEPNYLIVRKQNHNINNLQDLRKKTVIVKEKSITYNILKEISTNIDIIFVKSDIMMYKRLFEDKNTDALITYKKDADLLKKYNLKVVRTIYDKFSEVSIGVNKKYPYLQSIINKVHKAIPNDELFNLRNKIYNTKPYKGQINTQNQDKKLINLTSEEKNYLKNKKEIKICLDPNWMPFEKLNEDGKHIGISSDYFKIFEKELNIPITPIKTKSWTQTLEFAKNRKCDILTLGNETPKRKKYLNFTQPYLQIPFVMVTKNNVPFFNNFKYLKNEKIGVVKNSSLEETLKTKYPNLNLVKVKSNQDGLEKLQNNELFGYIGNMLSIGHILKKDFIQELKIINKLDDETSNLAIGVRNDDDILYGIFQKLVANIDNDTKNKILNKYRASLKTTHLTK